MLISLPLFKPVRLNTNSALKLTFRERPGPSIFLHKKTSARTVPENQPLLDLLLFRFVYYAIHTGETDLPQKSCQQVGRKMCCQVHHSEIVQSSCWHLEKFTTNYVEKTAGILSTCHDQGDMKLARGVPYEPHKLSQGADQKKQFVLLQKLPDVIYAPSTVVNHNGINMEGKFSSYKWKVPCFPTNTTQRCVLRIR